MVAPADHPVFTLGDGARLAAFFQQGQCYIALASHTGQPIHELLSWALQPHIQQAIDIMQRARREARRTEALDILQTLARDSTDPVEQRRAATAIVRITHPHHLHPHRAPHREQRHAAPGALDRAAPPFNAPPGLAGDPPAAPPPHIPAHYKRVNTFVYSEAPSRSLSPRQVIAKALALIQQGDAPALHALFDHSTFAGRFQTKDADEFEPIARQKLANCIDFQAAFAAPLVQTGRQRARQDVIIIPRSGDPAAFTIHLHYLMFGECEYCWLIDRYTRNSRFASSSQHPAPPAPPTPATPAPPANSS
jgi:hypothetical protein